MNRRLAALVRSSASCQAAWLGAVWFAGLGLGCGVEEVELRSHATGVVVVARPPVALEVTEQDAGVAPVRQLEAPRYDDFAAGSAPPVEKGCQKVDFLFVVDNSSSMLLEQSNLTNSFPGFLRVVQESLEARDFHIMVVDTDGWDGESSAAANADPCRNALGAGKRLGSNGQDCGVAGADRYLSKDQPNLEKTFSCVAKVGTFGDSGEQPMDAMIQAVGLAQNQRGGCNESFLRDDAILVVTFITDEDDTRSSGNPELWRQALLDSKRGDEKALVVLGLVNDANLDEPLAGGRCGSLLAPLTPLSPLAPLTQGGAPALQSFVQGFAQGSLASVCAPDYGPFFAQAVGSIDNACDEFVPPVIR